MASAGDECSVPHTLFNTAERGTGTGIMTGHHPSLMKNQVGATGICFLIWFW